MACGKRRAAWSNPGIEQGKGMSATITGNLSPIAVTERIEAMDVLRGFALLGILLMNLEGFVGPVMAAASASISSEKSSALFTLTSTPP